MLPAPDIAKGTTFGKYEILRKLATGGMAEIYLSRVRGTAGFEKLVVLKRILPNVAEDPMFVQMFLDEARLAATLQHPNIADVYDVGEDNGSYFFTMEFIYGEDARTVRIMSRKKGETVPLSHALAIVHGTAAALAYAHNKVGPEGPLGLVHRDVSSSNILISFDGAVKLVDFGIARATSRQHKTRTGTLKGKIPYMSPEQCQNRPLDRRSDLFSLGVVLYELTVGRRPFRGDSDFEILDQIINKGAPKPSQYDPAYPAPLEDIVMRLLQRSRDARYQSCEELIKDLEAFMASQGAWISAMTLGRYMRDLFADKITAWEAAMDHGTSLGDHVASTITSESMRNELRRTPPSAFTAQPAPPEDVPDTKFMTIEPSEPVEPVLPELRSSRKGLWLGLAGVAVIAGAIGVVTLGGSRPNAPASVAAPAPSPSPTPAPKPAPPPAPTPAAAPAPTPAPVAAPTPTPTPPTVAAPTPAPAKPIVKRAKPAVAVKPKPDPKPDPKPEPPKDPPKDNKWDRNSLTLPK
jgi:serine/threonine protein kinase